MIEWTYALVNGLGVLFTAAALRDAWRTQRAVGELNGYARELAASGNVRREVFHLAVQSILLALAVPALVIPGDAPLNYLVAALIVVSLLLLHSSTMDRRDRRELVTLARAELEREARHRGPTDRRHEEDPDDATARA